MKESTEPPERSIVRFDVEVYVRGDRTERRVRSEVPLDAALQALRGRDGVVRVTDPRGRAVVVTIRGGEVVRSEVVDRQEEIEW